MSVLILEDKNKENTDSIVNEDDFLLAGPQKTSFSEKAFSEKKFAKANLVRTLEKVEEKPYRSPFAFYAFGMAYARVAAVTDSAIAVDMSNRRIARVAHSAVLIDVANS